MLPVQKDSFPETPGRTEQRHTNLLEVILPINNSYRCALANFLSPQPIRWLSVL